ENLKLWEEASPLTHVSKNTPPTLFINSSVARMHAGRDDFMKVLKEANIYTEAQTFENSPHHFPFFDPWFDPMVKYIDGFLKKVFKYAP
ncbi:MAG: alpha/beta hydrolase, partial [Chitinophagaceae bacterium]